MRVVSNFSELCVGGSTSVALFNRYDDGEKNIATREGVASAYAVADYAREFAEQLQQSVEGGLLDGYIRGGASMQEIDDRITDFISRRVEDKCHNDVSSMLALVADGYGEGSAYRGFVEQGLPTVTRAIMRYLQYKLGVSVESLVDAARQRNNQGE